jgi:hypothetical protein
MPRPRSDSASYEASLTGRLDYVLTRTRPVRQGISTIGKLRLARPRVESLDLSYPPTLRQKVRAFNTTTYYLLPPWLQPRSTWEQYQCQSSLFTAHPGMGGENLSLYTPYGTLFRHRPPSMRIRQGPYPMIPGIRPYPPSLDPASTRPRRTPPVSRKERLTWNRTHGLFTVSSPMSPRCPGMASHSWGTSLQPPLQGSTKLHLKKPRRPGLLLPY